MPKLKTNRGAAKRFRRTAKGFKHRGSNRNHMLTHKPAKRRRRLRGMREVTKGDAGLLDRMLPKKTR